MLTSKVSRLLLSVAACAILVAGPVALADDTTLLGDNDPPQPGEPTREPPSLVLSFSDPIGMHNMSICSDGEYYYTTNGGNAASGEIRTYDLAGTPVHNVSCLIDARAILYNPADGELYIKSYDLNWYRVDPWDGSFTVVFSGIFQWSQSSPTLTPDGQYILEHENGTIRWLDSTTGQEVDAQYGYYYGSSPSGEAVATDGCRIFTWDGTLTYVYAMDGGFIESWNIPQGHYGFSLGWANGLLWASDDGANMWYGYDVGTEPSPTESTTWGAIKSLYR